MCQGINIFCTHLLGELLLLHIISPFDAGHKSLTKCTSVWLN